MKVEKMELRPAIVLEKLVCDRCGKEATSGADDFEFEEFLQVNFVAGYGAVVFEDETRVQGDFCQYCVKELLGPWLKISDASFMETK
jgi:hypothetical protein